MKKIQTKITVGVLCALTLIFSFYMGGNAPSLRGIPSEAPQTETVSVKQPTAANPNEVSESEIDNSVITESTPKPSDQSEYAVVQEPVQSDIEYSEEQGMEIDDSTGTDEYQTEPVPEGQPIPAEPQEAAVSDKERTCTLSVRCDTILDNIDWLDSEMNDLIPEEGIILAEQTVPFYEGESVFNLLVREMKRNKIHLEFVNTPIYNSAYIEGIANIYEFDCGELSGWIYKGNDWAPNYGCSRYQLKEGDRVEWVYTCDLGIDVRSYYTAE